MPSEHIVYRVVGTFGTIYTVEVTCDRFSVSLGPALQVPGQRADLAELNRMLSAWLADKNK